MRVTAVCDEQARRAQPPADRTRVKGRLAYRDVVVVVVVVVVVGGVVVVVVVGVG